MDKVNEERVATHKTQCVKWEKARFRQEASFAFIKKLTQTATDQKITEAGDQGEIVGGGKIRGIDTEGKEKIGIGIDTLHQIFCANYSQSHGDQHPPRKLSEKRLKEHTKTNTV